MAKTITLEMSDPQLAVMNARTRIIAEIAGQGAGKTMTLGLLVAMKILQFPEVKGFIGANTHEQLSGATLTRLFKVFEDIYQMTEYDKQNNPTGHYVINKKPPVNARWRKPKYTFKNYNNIISFWNGATVFLGSLENYKAHDGKEFGWAHLDETKDTKEEAITAVILGRLRQKGLYTDGAGIFWEPEATDERITTMGWRSWNPLYIHTSPAEGNVDWLVRLLGIAPYEREIRKRIQRPGDYFHRETEKDGKAVCSVTIYSTYHNKPNLPKNFIEDQKSTKSANEILKFIYGYPFGQAGGEFYPNFDRYRHTAKLNYVKGLPIHLTWDFNVLPYVTCLLAQVEYITKYYNPVTKVKKLVPFDGAQTLEVLQIRVFREICMPPPTNTTEQTAARVVEDYAADNPEVYVYGDASGRGRIEGLGSLTQYKIIERALAEGIYLADGYLRVDKVNIAVMKRRDFMNRVFEDKVPEIELLINESCTQTIRDCEYLLQSAKGGKHKERVTDKNGISYEVIGHTSDALEYLVCKVCLSYMKEM